jgi:murein DD-endopeptidase MepM/ murein hydrolase activator NlpD
VSVQVDLIPGVDLAGVFDDEQLNFAAQGDTHYALFGIHGLAEPGVYTLALLASDGSGDEVYVTRSIAVVDGGYGYEEIVLGPDRDELLDPVALAAERARLAEIKPVFNPERYWDGLFMRPITTELTSLFGTTRLYRSPSYESYGYHEGTDFDGDVGSAVYAPAPGIVVLAEPLFVRGNALIMDHGWGVYSGFWHLSQFEVKVGQRVEAGDLIARVGHTGLSTGAHLHWDFWVNGTNVSALQWTEHLFP